MTLAARLAGTRSVVFLTGAGISAESGLPTFRDAMTGLWARFRPEELATPEAFRSQPEVVWQWYRWRREQAAQARPNPGHKALAALQRRLPDALIVTQNVDGLHQRAGSHHVIELHGSLGRDRCSDAGCEVQTPGHDTLTPPGCPLCGAPLRPAVVWFGEALPADALRHAQERAAGCGVFFSIGTSSQVYPAAELAEIASRAGAAIVEINPSATPLTPLADFVFNAPGGTVLPDLLRSYERLTQTGVTL
jgi:NAD-dependent deacetylase